MAAISENGREYKVTYIVRVSVARPGFNAMQDKAFDSLEAAVECARAADYSALWTEDEVRDVVREDGSVRAMSGCIKVRKVAVAALRSETIN